MKKKILIIHHHSKFGGSSKSISEYLKLLKNNFEFELICPHGTAENFFRENKFKVHGIRGISNFNITEIGLYKNFRLLILIREFYYLIFTILIFFNLRKKKYDLIHLNDSSLIILSPLIKFFFKSKIVCHIRTRLEKKKFFLKPFFIFLIKNYINKIICIDQSTYDTCYVKSKATIIYNIFYPNKIKTKKINKFNIGFIGTLDFHKGIDFLFKCIEEINKNNLDIYFLIGGDISVKNNFLSSLLDLMKIKKNIKKNLFLYKQKLKNVKFVGPVKNLENFYKKLSLIVFPSRMNALGRPVIEASHFGIPAVVCLKNKKFKDTLIHGKTGYVTNFGDKKSFVKYLLKLAKDKKLLNQFKKNSFKLFSNTHNVQKNLRKIKSVYYQNIK